MNKADRNRYICVAVTALVQGLILGVYALITSGMPALERLNITPPDFLYMMPLGVIVIVPMVFWLSQEQWGRRLWIMLAGLTAVLTVLWLYRLWTFSGSTEINSASFTQKADLIRTSLAVFLVIPYFQCRIISWSWHIPYTEIFFQLCRNVFLLFQAMIVEGVFWGMLIVGGLLFDIITASGVVSMILFNPFVAVPLAMIIMAVSISVAIKHPGIDSLGRWLLSVLAWLLPFFSLLSLAFLVCILWGGTRGLHALWNTGQASTLMLLLQAGTIILANAAWLDGSKSAFRTRSIDMLAQVSLLCLPVYSVLCFYSLSLRISQYGLTTDRIQAVFLTVISATWGIAYAGTVIARNWPVSLGRVNTACVLFLTLIVLLMNSPVLDPLRLSADDQIDRLNSGKVQPKNFDYGYLSSLGRFGRRYINELKNKPKSSSTLKHEGLIFTFEPDKVLIMSADKSVLGTVRGSFAPGIKHSVKTVPVPPNFEIDGKIYRPLYVPNISGFIGAHAPN
ncbi:MAG: DUF4153 domain-containing protein [Synergistaceae bacterium]|nr:DUF4153 domain-containing protein [Synergistaceae bacterium]